ncbi:MAG: hypothetical protein A2Z13_01425 [Deltaproteobacteria bacterium RBG_16_64_85]|nr:MAG: hypothetical protein A2Z13_01425 [Deltaproteobacteria bacterium RBG_16_64_85]
MKMKYFWVCATILAFLAFPLAGIAGEKGPGAMPGMKMEEHGKMGDKIFGGNLGPWQCEARLVDMKTHMEKAKASGMKMEGMMKSHHIAFGLTDPMTKKPMTVGKGSVTVVGPDKKKEKTDFMAMESHFGADVNLPKPGKYTFKGRFGGQEWVCDVYAQRGIAIREFHEEYSRAN